MSKRQMLVVLLFTAMSVATGHAQKNNWVGPYGGQWNDPNNWSLGVVPNDGFQDAAINSGAGDLVLLNNPGDLAWANSVSLGSNIASPPSELQISNTVIFYTGLLNIYQSGVFRATDVTSPSWWLPYPPIWVTGDTGNAGQMLLTGTTMQNDGNLNNSGTMYLTNSTLNVGGSLNNSGAISVGYSQIQGSLQMMPGSSLTVIAPLQVSDLSAFQVIPDSTRYDISADVTEIATGQSALSSLTEIDGDLRLHGKRRPMAA